MLGMVCAAILYLRVIEFTLSARELLIDEIARATGKKAFCTAVRFDLLKGLVLDRVVLYDGKNVVIRASQVSSGFLIPSLFSKRVIVPVITVSSPVIYAERSPDGSLNLFGLIPKEYASRSGLAVSVHRIIVRHGVIVFVDRTAYPELVKKLTDFELEIKLYLPIRATFRSSFKIPASTTIKITGEYVIPKAELAADLSSDDLSLQDFAYYYRPYGFILPEGAAAVKAAVRIKDGLATADIAASAREVLAVSGKVRTKADCDVRAVVRYDIAGKTADFSGEADILRMSIEGILPEEAGRIENIRAKATFDRMRLASDDARAEVLGMKWDAKVNIVNFASPIIDVYAHSSVHLAALEETLRKRLGVKFPTEIAGRGDLLISMQSEPGREVKFKGNLSVNDATARLGKGNFPIEKLSGEFQFDANEARWRHISASYRGVGYRSSGSIKSFESPRIQLEVSSKDLSYQSLLSMAGNTINITSLDGKYFNSRFSAKGDMNLEDPGAVEADIKGSLDFDLADLRRISPGSGGVRKMRPAGKLHAELELSGDVKDLRTCYVDAKIKSKQMSVYGVRMTDATLAFLQEQGVGNIRQFRADLYGGTLAVSGRIDWLAKGMPYAVNIDAIGVKMDRLKEDTDFKDKDVSGDVKVYADVKGVFRDASRFTGIGHAGIKNGKLWQLNLFKGTGAMIFSRDFSDVVFTEGACDWKVDGNSLSIENLVMKSDLLTLRGAGKIGFDRSVKGMIRPEVDEDEAGTGTLASAVGKGTVIEIGGTLKDPAFKTRTNVIDVVGAMLDRQ